MGRNPTPNTPARAPPPRARGQDSQPCRQAGGAQRGCDGLLVCAPPPPPRHPQRGRWAEGAAVLARPRPQARLHLYEWTRAGDPSSRPLRSLSGICPARGRGSPSPGPPVPHPLTPPPLTANSLTPHLPGHPHACREAPTREGRGFSQISRQMGAGGRGSDPGLAQRSTPPPPESLPSLLTQREPRTAPGHIHRALPPAFSSLLCVCMPLALTSAPRGQGLCVPPVPWRYTRAGRARGTRCTRARLKGQGLVSPGLAQGGGPTRPAA